MIIPDHIVALALLAIDDPDAVQVLEDAMIEDGRDWRAVYWMPIDKEWEQCITLTLPGLSPRRPGKPWQ